jgi:Leucine-rich repeat (LRR) protein
MPGLRALRLNNTRLDGAVPGGKLSDRFSHLDLSNTSVAGELPDAWGSSSELRWLSLSMTSVAGTLPSSWGQLTWLRVLRLDGTRLSGSIPASWFGGASSFGMQQLQTLWLDASDDVSGDWGARWQGLAELRNLALPPVMRGVLSDASSIANLTSLEELSWLGWGPAGAGTLPAAWSRLQRLRVLRLGAQLSGTLPVGWGGLRALEDLTLDLGRGHRDPVVGLSRLAPHGVLPAAWGRGGLPALRRLSLTGNFSGTLPPEWSGLAVLEEVDLSGNRLSGSLPGSWGSLGRLKSLRRLSLKGNLSGTLPPEWSGLSMLEQVDLSGNRLTGSLPGSWGSLARLELVDVAENLFSGTLPASWGRLTRMKGLRFMANARLSGTVPASWDALGATLEWVQLSGTNLTGCLPRTWSRAVASSWSSPLPAGMDLCRGG